MTPDIPEHITPQAIYQMTGEQLDTLVDNLRERRLAPVQQYEAAKKAAQEAADDKARVLLFKQCEMLEKNIDRADKAFSALETRVTKIRALRMELELD